MPPFETKNDDRRRLVIGITSAVIAVGALVYVFWGQEKDASKPAEKPAVTAEAKKAEAEKKAVPAFDLVRISRGGTGVIAGRMAPGAVVELYANGKKVSEVTADENGEWVMILEQPLESGSVELNLKAHQGDKGPVSEADKVVVVSVPKRDNQHFLERQQNGVVAVLTPKNGEGASTVLQKPGVAAYAEVGESLSVDTIDYGDGGQPVIAGHSLPRVEVRVYMDGSYVGNSRADDQGRWQVTHDGAFKPGQHVLRVDQTISEGKVQLRIEQPFSTGEPLDPTSAESGVFIRPGNTLWQIARQLYGSGVRYTLIFRENSEQIKDPDLIYPGQIFRLPKKAETKKEG
ncbi:LysM peptidoglycan-binding domain-containing protein [Kordiimonas marina]|uniref:LysM peptidoglycan-binding domain-containing protein n=1 Tax=Kordiimonas marina TaxID=2872312 RepID=UPI001FF2B248|nr:LysM peptidoglycan-binding domain-containing protein [Kordiimonas marina]MCJ9429014.1 LysM peptidoglycan-binding domain-containing protein [Kordiimonas marina]